MRQQQKSQYSGGMTAGARKRMAKAITLMTQAIKPKWVYNPVSLKYQYHTFSFITLTIACPRNVTARFAYDHLLAPFLDWLRKTMEVKTYIWKAELQERGQIHYHITTPAWIHHQYIKRKWNELQRDAGLLAEYAAEHGHFNPNSTDIHNTRNVRKMDQYLVKELAKSFAAIQVQAITEVNEMVKAGQLSPAMAEEKIAEIEAEKITTIGKIWDCSNDLTGVSYYTTPLTDAHMQIIRGWIAEGTAREKVDDFYSLIMVDNADPPDILSPGEKTGFTNYLRWVMDRNYKVEEIPASVVQMEQMDTELSYTWSQIELSLN